MQYTYKNEKSGLTDTNVLDIRRIASETDLSLFEIASLYGIGKSTVSDIVNYKTWNHVPSPVVNASGYEIYPDGRVRNLTTNKFLTPRFSNKNGVTVKMKNKSVDLAKLVAKTFHNKNTVKFIDGNRQNIHFANLAG